ncbi:MAG: STAS domain-containing protein [Actinomycetota bacterium]|nr:STAS domain-containing protein [Actinomycetota bacterium]
MSRQSRIGSAQVLRLLPRLPLALLSSRTFPRLGSQPAQIFGVRHSDGAATEQERTVTGQPGAFEVQVLEPGEPTVIAVSGELDMHTAAALDDVLSALLRDGLATSHLVLDLAGVSFIDASGLRPLVATSNTLTERGGRLELRSASMTVHRIASLTDLQNDLGLAHTDGHRPASSPGA